MQKKSLRAAFVATLVSGLLAAGGTAAMADTAADPYCDTVLPILYKIGYNGEDPRCN